MISPFEQLGYFVNHSIDKKKVSRHQPGTFSGYK